MKLIIAIVHDEFSDMVSRSLTNAEYRVTTIASTGGFLKRGRTTLLCGVEDEQLNKALDLIRKSIPTVSADAGTRCTLFVINVADYYRF
jgi:uncharacterized protein YaaQ